ncbi:hypothetical protein BH23ACT5_BH23ACT5_23120 [soil metagenome]
MTDAEWVDNDVRASLTDPEFDITRVSDPRLAVAAAVEHAAAVAIVDMQVGSMGGMAVVRALRSASQSGEIGPLRTVLLLDRLADHFLAGRAGADVAIAKPFTAQDLRKAAALPTSPATSVH